jgi:hypothetical protein
VPKNAGSTVPRPRLDNSLEEALEETFQVSEPVNVSQPPPSKADHSVKRHRLCGPRLLKYIIITISYGIIAAVFAGNDSSYFLKPF